jgi:hypothetical protein
MPNFKTSAHSEDQVRVMDIIIDTHRVSDDTPVVGCAPR